MRDQLWSLMLGAGSPEVLSMWADMLGQNIWGLGLYKDDFLATVIQHYWRTNLPGDFLALYNAATAHQGQMRQIMWQTVVKAGNADVNALLADMKGANHWGLFGHESKLLQAVSLHYRKTEAAADFRAVYAGVNPSLKQYMRLTLWREAIATSDAVVSALFADMSNADVWGLAGHEKELLEQATAHYRISEAHGDFRALYQSISIPGKERMREVMWDAALLGGCAKINELIADMKAANLWGLAGYENELLGHALSHYWQDHAYGDFRAIYGGVDAAAQTHMRTKMWALALEEGKAALLELVRDLLGANLWGLALFRDELLSTAVRHYKEKNAIGDFLALHGDLDGVEQGRLRNKLWFLFINDGSDPVLGLLTDMEGGNTWHLAGYKFEFLTKLVANFYMKNLLNDFRLIYNAAEPGIRIAMGEVLALLAFNYRFDRANRNRRETSIIAVNPLMVPEPWRPYIPEHRWAVER
jgi:hypothetical protein